MSEEEYNEIYETTKNNSIGEEKKSPVNKNNTAIKIAAGVLVAILATAGIIALFAPKKEKTK